MNVLIVEDDIDRLDAWIDGFAEIKWHVNHLTTQLTNSSGAFDSTLGCCEEFFLIGGDLIVVLDLDLGGASLDRASRQTVPERHSSSNGGSAKSFLIGQGADGVCFGLEFIDKIYECVSRPGHPSIRVLFVIASFTEAYMGPLQFLRDHISKKMLNESVRFGTVLLDARSVGEAAADVRRIWNLEFPESDLELFEAYLDRVLHGATGLDAHKPIENSARTIFDESDRIFKWQMKVTEDESTELSKILRGCRGTKLTGYSALLLAIASASRAGNDGTHLGRKAPGMGKAEDIKNLLRSANLISYLPIDSDGSLELRCLWRLLESLFEYDERHAESTPPILTCDSDGFTIHTSWNYVRLRERCVEVERGSVGRSTAQTIIEFAGLLPQNGILWVDEIKGGNFDLARFGIRRSESGVDFVFGFFQ